MVEAQQPEALAAQILKFLEDQPSSVLVESGRILFDLRLARVTVATEHGRCVLHVRSDEHDLIRNVVGVTVRKFGLRLHVLRMGQSKPQTLELHPQQRRLPSQRDTARTRYLPVVERACAAAFPDWQMEGLRTAMDLERSFGPAYARGLLIRGGAAQAIIAINAEESQALIDGVLTLGVLWLHHCREHSDGRRFIAGLKVIVPLGRATVTAERMAWMDTRAGAWELYELDEASEKLYARDPTNQGNLEARLFHAPDLTAARERFGPAIDRVRALFPPGSAAEVEVVFRSGSEVALLWHGLECARIETAVQENFRHAERIVFGSGSSATELSTESEAKICGLLRELVQRRRPEGNKRDVLYRQQTERWLESRLRRSPEAIDAGLLPEPIYAQVPAFTAADRAVLDLLAIRRNGRLVVIEIKADEDLHLAMQALDYWIRVRRHQQPAAGLEKSELERLGYFPGRPISQETPLLLLVAPALRIHPANETVLRYFSPQVEWTLVALDERWRETVRVVFRKRRTP